jgi:hypothetical protein
MAVFPDIVRVRVSAMGLMDIYAIRGQDLLLLFCLFRLQIAITVEPLDR